MYIRPKLTFVSFFSIFFYFAAFPYYNYHQITCVRLFGALLATGARGAERAVRIWNVEVEKLFLLDRVENTFKTMSRSKFHPKIDIFDGKQPQTGAACLRELRLENNVRCLSFDATRCHHEFDSSHIL